MAQLSRVIDIGSWRPPIRTEHIPPREPCASADELREAFRDRLQIPTQLEPTFDRALCYLLDRPGSMVRPRMLCQMASEYGVRNQAAIDLAIAIEYFHSASLVFDDLPCMDNASMRRGAPCVHLPYGEANAILAALALINRAYALAWRAVSCCPPDSRRPALSYIEQRLGVEGLLNGQSLDLNYGALPHTLSSTERVARDKTVSLFSLSLVLPAMLGKASSRELQLLKRISVCWGLGYQIVDDLKDVLQGSSDTGKTPARDGYLDRPNLALAIGIPAAVERLTRLLQIGDRNLDMLLEARRSLVFLRELRSVLQNELNGVIADTAATPVESRR